MDIAAIDTRRERLGISQSRLCGAAGVDQSTYCRIRGGISGGRVETLRRLATALDQLESGLRVVLEERERE